MGIKRLLTFNFIIILTTALLYGETNFPEARIDILADIESQAITFLQDKDGFIWIGTIIDGVYRFDGKTLQRYLGPGHRITGSNIPCIFEDSKGNLWFADNGVGVHRFDKERNTITSYSHDPKNSNSISSNSFYWSGRQVITEDRFGNIWIGVYGAGLNRLDPKTGTFKHYQHDPEDSTSLSNNGIRSVFIDSVGNLWIGTEKGLNLFDDKAETFSHYFPDKKNTNSISGRVVTSIIESRDKGLWFGTENQGLNRFDREQKTFTQYQYTARQSKHRDVQPIYAIYEDQFNNFWLLHEASATYFDRRQNEFQQYDVDYTDMIYSPQDQITWILYNSGKLGKYEKNKSKFELYRHDAKNKNSLSHEAVVPILEDSQGIIWIGIFQGGLNRYDHKTKQFKHYLHDPNNPGSIQSTVNYVSGIYEDRSGNLWLGNAVPGTISIFDRIQDKVIKTYRHDPDNPNSLPDVTQVNNIYQDYEHSDIYWLSSAKGLVWFDKTNEVFKIIDQEDSWDLYDDGTGFIYYTTFGNGLKKLNKQSGQITVYRHDPEDSNSIAGNTLIPIFKASDNQIWVGSDRGLDLFDPETEIFIHYNRDNGYPFDSVITIGEDLNGTLWMGTNSGLAKFNPKSLESRLYTKLDGAQSNTFYASNGIRSRNGIMWFGGTKGMNSFDPDQIKDNLHIPPIRLTSIKQSGVEINFGKAPERLDSIELDWRDNFFEFEFVAFDYTIPDKNQYAYILEGFDDQWYYSGTNNFGRYSKIPAGSYRLRLKASNNDGIWNEQGIAIEVLVHSPPWLSWWAYVLYLLLIIALVIGYHRYQRSKFIQERKTADRLKILDKLKDDFLANTSHELRTPLNGIIGLAESLMDGVAGKLSKKVTDNLTMISLSGRRLTHLVNDLLDFSKMENQDLRLSIKPTDLYSVINIVLIVLKPTMQKKEIQLINKISQNLPLIAADPDRLQQIFHNLVGNAIKFTSKGEVSISTRQLQGTIEIHVSDSGIGISKEKLSAIFNKFEQADGSIAREYGGTGLGLTITQQLIKLHGGEIRVESELGQGATFIFDIPVFTDDPGIKSEQPVTSEIIHERILDPFEVSVQIEESVFTELDAYILLVDDDLINLQVLENLLSLKKYRTKQVSNGTDALKVIDAAKRLPDLVLLDIMMPKVNGYEVCQRLREKYKMIELPIIFITAKNQINDLVMGLQYGANDYLSKPFTKEELYSRIRNQIIQKKQNEEINTSLQKLAEVNQAFETLNYELEDKVQERTLALEKALMLQQSTQDQLIQSERLAALGNMVAGVAHEINTPLGIGVTEASFLVEKVKELIDLHSLEQLTQSKFQASLKFIDESASSILRNLTRSADLIRSFKLVAVDQTVFHKRTFRIKSYIDNIILSLKPELKKTKHSIVNICSESLTIESYPGAFSQIITNFVMNSLLHGFDNHQRGKIKITTQKTDNTLRLSYEDDGKGMDEKTLKQVFDPFFTTKRAEGGTGLGMQIVYNIVTQKLQGSIDCYSSPGKGVEFRIILPLNL